ncbi:MAG: DUF1203 domain-containing protein [Pseudomonadota bacterium]
MRGYSSDDSIVYGAGGVVATDKISAHAVRLFEDASVADLHVRSASNTCNHCRIERV